MFAAKFVEICKEENGYSVEVPVGLHLGETQYKTYVFPTYREASEFIGKAIGVAQEEIYTYSHDGSLRAWRDTVNMVEREPSKDELRDELGEMRRKLERSTPATSTSAPRMMPWRSSSMPSKLPLLRVKRKPRRASGKA